MRSLLLLLAALTLIASGWSAGTIRIGAFSQGDPGQLPADWEPMKLGRTAPSSYTLVREGEQVVIRAEARDAASGLVRRVNLDAKQYPVLEWRWKAENVIEKGAVDRKSGDDYAARIYVTFAYDPSDLSLGERMKYEAAKAISGGDVPLRALSYIWANHPGETDIVANPYTDWVMMVPVESGAANVGAWRTERRNLYDDYRRAFGEEPPAISGIAVMTDTDDTGATATAYYGDIVLKSE
jgi:hypothetical protein